WNRGHIITHRSFMLIARFKRCLRRKISDFRNNTAANIHTALRPQRERLITGYAAENIGKGHQCFMTHSIFIVNGFYADLRWSQIFGLMAAEVGESFVDGYQATPR